MRAPIAVVVSCLLGYLVSAPSALAATSVDLVATTGNTALPGSQIILQTFVTANGGETDYGVAGLIEYQGTWVDSNPASNTQVDLSTVGTAAPNWITGALTCGPAACVAFSQISVDPVTLDPDPVEAGLTDFPLAATRFFVDPATPIGTVLQFAWRTTPTSSGLDWYGVTNAHGVSITVIPEPATAALLATGLVGLGITRRR